MEEHLRNGETWLYSDLTQKILACAMAVSNELGVGFVESVYREALYLALSEKSLSVEVEKPMLVTFRNQIVGKFRADMVVEGRVIVELKAVRTFCPEHYAQVMNYLKASGQQLGLLLNFGNPRLEYRRVILSRREKPEEPTENDAVNTERAFL